MFALGGFVVGVEDFADVFGHHFFIYRAVVVSGVEGLEVEGLGGFGFPEAEEVDCIVFVAGDRGVVGGAAHDALRYPADAVGSVFVVALGMAAEFDVKDDFGSGNFPRVAEAEPFIGDFDLPSIADGLIEDPEFVTDAVADGGDLEGGEGVEVAGGEASEAAVAEARFFFLFEEVIEVDVELAESSAGDVEDTEVDEVIAELGSHEEFGGQVSDCSAFGLVIGFGGIDPAVEESVTDGVGEGHVAVVGGGDGGEASLEVIEIIAEGAGDGFCAEPGACRFLGGGLAGGVGVLGAGLTHYGGETRFRGAERKGGSFWCSIGAHRARPRRVLCGVGGGWTPAICQRQALTDPEARVVAWDGKKAQKAFHRAFLGWENCLCLSG
ncbi:MAG: hypothetical protein RI897_1415 [Verrucomicrobiota bacterium]